MLPELNDILVDYDIPLNEKIPSIYALPASQRPLVHIFLIYEYMEMDTIQAVS